MLPPSLISIIGFLGLTEKVLALPTASSLATRAAGYTKDARTEEHRAATTKVGHDHGSAFDDFRIVSTAQHLRLSSIKLLGCGPGEHLSGIKLAFRNNWGTNDPASVVSQVNHGAGGGSTQENSLALLQGERINEVHTTTWRKKINTSPMSRTFHTRIGWIKFVTSRGIEVECGSKLDSDHINVWNPEKKSLLYFTGSQGDVIDALQAYFIPNDDY